MARSVIRLTLWFLVASATAGVSQPLVMGISGELVEGSQVTISGIGFGAKSTDGPFLWDTFESGTVGGQIHYNDAVIGTWAGSHQSQVPVYSSAQSRIGNYSAYLDFINNYTANLSQNRTITKLFISWWYRHELVDNRSRNQKFLRLYGANDQLQLAVPTAPCTGNLRWDTSHLGTSCQRAWGAGNEAYYPANEEWHQFQVEYEESDPALENGAVRLYINGNLVLNYTGYTRCTDVHLNQIRLGHYWSREAVDPCPANGGAHVWIDDVYMDESWARVVIGDSSTWASCTYHEVQIVTAWLDNEIQITINQGALVAGDTAYLYVVSESGVPSDSGFQIVIGGDFNDPGPPGSSSPPVFEEF